MNGKLIVFEGIDGSGKTTQAQLVHQFLKDKGILNSLFREPGGTPLGEAIRKILLAREDFHGGIGSTAEYLLFAAARAELSRLIIKPMLDKGITVLLDRFGLSSVVYQGYGRGLDVDFIKQVNDMATVGIQPDLVMLFDLPVETALARIGSSQDRIEQNGAEFFSKVRDGYLREIKTYGDVGNVIDASENVEAVLAQVQAVVDLLYA